MVAQITIFSISSKLIVSPVRSYSFVVLADSWAAILWACSSLPLQDRYAVIPVARKVWQQVDAGSYSPFVAPDDTEVLSTALFQWSPAARFNMTVSSWLNPRNYRRYVGAGIGHVELLTPPGESFPSGNFFDEASARNTPLTDWIDDMLNNYSRWWWRSDWRNLTCFPRCVGP